MVGRRPGSRERMIRSAVALLSSRGVGGTTIDAVLGHSGAPRGSVYHHFPGGRDQLVAEAARAAAGRMTAAVDQGLAGSTPRQVLDRMADFWGRLLVRSDFTAGCPVVAVVVTGDEAPAEQQAVPPEAFGAWQDRVAALLIAQGVDRRRAPRLAALTVAAFEGAILMARARRSLEPLEQVVAELGDLLDASAPDAVAPVEGDGALGRD